MYIYYRGENEGDQDRLNMLSCGSEWVWVWVWVGGSESNVESTLLYSTRLDLIASKKLTGPLPIEKEDDVTFIPTSSAK